MLVELTRIEGSQHGPLVAAQMMDVTVRVVAIRHFAVAQMALLLDNAHVLATAAHKNTMLEVGRWGTGKEGREYVGVGRIMEMAADYLTSQFDLTQL